jgi:hypothetical protein
MIELEVNKKVLLALKNSFPKPEKSAERALTKYVAALTEQLNQSQLMGRNGIQIKNNWFHISLYKQRNNAGQIGKDKIRLQNWLEQNNLELFKVIEKGSNFSHKLTLIKLSKWVTIKATKPAVDTETAELAELEQINALDDDAFIQKLYPMIDQLTQAEISEQYDLVPIDRSSLTNYLRWITETATLISSKDKERIAAQATQILRVAHYTNGNYLQKRKQSSFGRVYYEGVSVQNIKKELREAMIGHGYEYDIKSSVFTWKMCYAKEVIDGLSTDEQVREHFKNTILFLEDKQDFFNYIRSRTFESDSNAQQDLQIKLIKQAITAIGFGARLNGTGWKYAGEQYNTSMGTIFKNPDERKRFISCDLVRDFVKEQSLLDSYIFDAGKSQPAEYFGSADIRTQSGRLSKAKVLAFLYQTFETELMDLVCNLIEEKGKRVIARIHDAVITKQKLSVDDREEILYKIKQATENEYWRLNHKELKPFVYDSEEPIKAEQVKESTLSSWFGKLMG